MLVVVFPSEELPTVLLITAASSVTARTTETITSILESDVCMFRMECSLEIGESMINTVEKRRDSIYIYKGVLYRKVTAQLAVLQAIFKILAPEFPRYTH